MKNNFENTTCFTAHKQCKKNCNIKKCRYWHNLNDHNNCIINASNSKDEYTLEEIGDFFNVTRMRICQIEKIAKNKLKENYNLP